MPPLQVVVISPLLTHSEVPHAGGRYLLDLDRLLRARTSALTIVPNTPTNRDAATRSGTPDPFVIAGSRANRSIIARAAARLATVIDRHLRRIDPGLPSLSLAVELARDPRLRRAIRQADVIDLQWSESIRLAPLIRLLNRHARRVGTFHDVQSQLFAREPAPTRARRLYWRWIAAAARRYERRSLRRLDDVVVFSDKDAALLSDRRPIRVVHPPLAPSEPHRHTSSAPRHDVVFVSHLARPENDDAARWLVTDIWPVVRADHPEARLRLIGAGASAEVMALVATDPSLSAPGFVDSLAAVYEQAAVCVIPLRTGAGVKFKTVEALLHGVPVVTTAVGAEGIGSSDLYAAVTDDAREFAAGISAVLRDPSASDHRRSTAQRWAQDAYGWEQFETAIAASYGGTSRFESCPDSGA